jgi:hypothetical protein
MNAKTLLSLILSLLFGGAMVFSGAGLCAEEQDHFK